MYHGIAAALRAAATSSTPVLWNICATVSDLRKSKVSTALTIRLGARLSGRPDRIVSDSNASARIHQKELKFSAKRWQVIPNGFDTEQFRPSAEARANIRAELSLPEDAQLI